MAFADQPDNVDKYFAAAARSVSNYNLTAPSDVITTLPRRYKSNFANKILCTRLASQWLVS